MEEQEKTRPVQIWIKPSTFEVLRVWSASKGKTANKLIAEMAERKAEKVRESVETLLS